MISQILELAASSTYDFRKTANLLDSNRCLFDEWAPYYRLKWAIAKALQPRRILEFGVGSGYSAAAFLDAAPESTYIGVGGDEDALSWARLITPIHRAEFLIQNQQVPEGMYDLVHFNGVQDATGLPDGLRNAFHQARHILIDGLFGNRDRFLKLSDFLFRYKDVIESVFMIPGYSGELLITPLSGESIATRAATSDAVKSAYNTHYYLRDCGGFNEFKRSKGGPLQDVRLKCVADIARIARPGRALDLGCGRGELSLHLAREGYDVLAIDYSTSAIELAREASRTAECASKIAYYCGDVNTAPFSGEYSLAVASDVIEHLSSDELDRLYQRVSRHLSREGVFVLHTFPNVWYYQYNHPLRVRKARALGAYLPLEPRPRYEELVHINEQSPRVLRRQLLGHFQHVLLWFADRALDKPFENLARRFSRAEMREAGDLFAIASHAPVDIGFLRSLVEMRPIPGPVKAGICVLHMPASARRGKLFQARVRLENGSSVELKSRGPNPVRLAYHCYSSANETLVFDGIRTDIPALKPGGSVEVTMDLRMPEVSGRVRFRVTLVQELVGWFDEPPHEIYAEVLIEPE